MPTLTALTPHPRRAGRYSVSVDGVVLTFDGTHGAAATALVDAALVQALGLKVGAELSADALRSLADGARQVKAMDRALGMLGRRAHSRRELERGLAQKGSPKAAIDTVLTQLSHRGLVDDRAYAESFARSRLVGRGQSRRRVAAELAKRGVARDAVEAALVTIAESEGVDELVQARRAAGKKVRGMSGLGPEVLRRRLVGFLIRQGFGGGVVRQITDELARR